MPTLPPIILQVHKKNADWIVKAILSERADSDGLLWERTYYAIMGYPAHVRDVLRQLR